MAACIGEPISWPRLEGHVLARDASITAHVAECAACRACLDEIERDVVALPALPAAATREPRRTRWWWFAIPALAAAALALLIVRPRDEAREDVATVKGVGEVVVGVVRERDGSVRDDVLAFRPNDRWKVVVTCAPDRGAWLDVAVSDDAGTDFPLAPAHVACGNRVAVPGAFSITGARPNHVCVLVGAASAPTRRTPHAGEADVACVTIVPE